MYMISYLSRDETELWAVTEAAPNPVPAWSSLQRPAKRPPSSLGPRALTACAEFRAILAEGLDYSAVLKVMQQTCQAMAL